MQKIENFDRETLFKYLRDQRELNSDFKMNLSELVKNLDENDQNVDLDFVRSAFNKFSRKHDSITPAFIVDFIKMIFEAQKSQSILDISMGFGEILFPLEESLETDQCLGIEMNHSKFSIAQHISPEEKIELINGDSQVELADLNRKFDLIVGNLPFGTGKGKKLFKVDSKELEISDNQEHILLFEALEKLSVNGTACFVVSKSFIIQGKDKNKSVLNNLDEIGCSVEALLSIPPGSFNHIGIGGVLVIIKKSEQESVFLGELSPETNNIQALAENYRENQEGSDKHLGTFVEFDDICLIEQLVEKEQIVRMARKSGLEPVKLSEIAESIEKNRDEFISEPNTVFMPTFPSSEAASEITSDMKPSGYIQIKLKEDNANAEYVASFLNTDLGRKIRSSISKGQTRSYTTLTTTRNATLYLPPIEIQQKVIELENTMQEIESGIETLRSDLWAHPYDYESKKKELEEINNSPEQDFQKLLRSLPFPLASVLHAHEATSDFRDKIHHLLNFFEAFSQFQATIFLSAYKSDDSFYKKKIHPLFKKDEHSLSRALERAQFGSWVEINKRLSKKTRRFLSGEEREQCRELFGNPEVSFLQNLSDKEFNESMEKANQYRNRWGGHDGYPVDKELEFRHSQVKNILTDIRTKLSELFRNTKVILAGSGDFLGDIHEYEVKELMGPTVPFNEEKIKTLKNLKRDYLYLYHDDRKKPVELLPFLKMMTSPEDQKNSCYFYNRVNKAGEVRWINYQFDSESERFTVDDDIRKTFEDFQNF